jgi:antitoxin ChpS
VSAFPLIAPEPPDDETVNAALEAFATAVRGAYGSRLKGIYLFGSRARGDHTRDSDADIAVVLADDGWRNWSESKRLAGIAYDFIVDTGTDIDAWPVSEREWRDPHHPLTSSMRNDARPIGRTNG